MNRSTGSRKSFQAAPLSPLQLPGPQELQEPTVLRSKEFLQRALKIFEMRKVY